MTERAPLVAATMALALSLACSLTGGPLVSTGIPTPVTAAPTSPPTEGPYPVRYYPDGDAFSVELPPGWEVKETGSADPLATATDTATGAILRLSMDSGARGSAADANLSFIKTWMGPALTSSDDGKGFAFSEGTDGWIREGTYTKSDAHPPEVGQWQAVTAILPGGTYHLAIAAPDPVMALVLPAFLASARSLRGEPTTPIDVPRDQALILSSGEPETLDPALTHSGPSDLIGDLFSGLVVLDPGMQVRPAIAESWDVSAGGTVFTFHLNPRARFHNGRPVVADDVRFSWERAARPATGSSTVLLYLGDIVGLAEFRAGSSDSIQGVRVLDDHTLQVTIDAPKPYFLAKLTYPVSWLVDRYQVSLPRWELHPNGTGPFRHVQHIKDQIFTLEPNPYYYGEPPRLAHLVYLMYAGYTQRLYQDGQVDFASLSRDQLDRAQDPTDGLYGRVVTEASLCTNYVSLNTALPPFDDARVRRAFALAVDRPRYVEAIANGEDTPGRGLLPPGMPGRSEAIHDPAYDPNQARALLAQSSYASKGLPPIVWTVPTSGGQASPEAALLTDMWKEVLGVTVTLEGVDWRDYYHQLDAGQYGQILLEGWCADYPDPENFLDVLFHSGSAQNHAHFTNPAFDRLVEAARTEADVTQRLSLYAQADQLLLDEAPAIVLSYPGPAFSVWKPYILGYQPAPIGVPQHQAMWIQH
jgi:oligopeptide transport system substrate-binding protein